jgi:hypothetical protein
MMRCAVATITLLSVVPCLAADGRSEAALRRLDPDARFEQVCALEAMRKIAHDETAFHPERALVNALSPVSVQGDEMRGSGGAFRSGRQWYNFSFACRASTDRLKVLSLQYRVGPSIPEVKWESYGLWR